MKVKVLVSFVRHVDGEATSFQPGSEHDVDSDLAQRLAAAELVEVVSEPEPEPEPEPKGKPAPKRNKSAGGAPENK